MGESTRMVFFACTGKTFFFVRGRHHDSRKAAQSGFHVGKIEEPTLLLDLVTWDALIVVDEYEHLLESMNTAGAFETLLGSGEVNEKIAAWCYVVEGHVRTCVE